VQEIVGLLSFVLWALLHALEHYLVEIVVLGESGGIQQFVEQYK